MITILSIDGGGIRGVIPAVILAELERQTGLPVCRLFDFVAGTSTGGLITAMLVCPGTGSAPKYTAAQVLSAYLELGGAVFRRSPIRAAATLGGLAGPRYSARSLEHYLKKYLGQARLGSALTNLLIPAYDMHSAEPWFFKSTFAEGRRSEMDNPMLWQVARATSAAPTFFPPFPMGGEHCFIDGGVFANNPALCAYAEMRALQPHESRCFVLSLGTGLCEQNYSCADVQHWGTLRWVPPLLGAMMNGSNATVNYQMLTLVGADNYLRIQPTIPTDLTNIDDADPKNLSQLLEVANKELQKRATELTRASRILKGNAKLTYAPAATKRTS